MCNVNEKQPDGPSESGPIRSEARPAVLVVDDDQEFMRACIRVLEGWDYDVTQATSCEDALDVVGRRFFDVILSDINLPGASGLEILRSVRARDPDVPVVLMTGGPELETARMAVEWGAQSYLIKPLPVPQLKEVLERVITAHRLARRQRVILAGTERQARETRHMREQFEASVAGMWMAFQPIVSWSSKSVVAYEALMRTTYTPLQYPTEILKVAELLGEVRALGHRTRALIAQVLESHAELPGVFVNLHALDLLDDHLYSRDNPLFPFASRIHFEITERMAIEKIEDTRGRVTKLRALGYKIAVDDLGEGYSGLNSFAALEPDAVKLDMSLIRGIETAPTKRRMVRALATLCRELKTPLVAEGVETTSELDVLIELGADWLQGYLFARPDYPLPIPRI
jgi:EAL domain-containing protein (putative c-di-GMP-specific phosphodiesterase class I)/CheY-like chemotaxis protein